jgi:hypothetical protein
MNDTSAPKSCTPAIQYRRSKKAPEDKVSEKYWMFIDPEEEYRQHVAHQKAQKQSEKTLPVKS